MLNNENDISTPITLEELMNKEFPASPWIAEPLIPADSITVMSGQPASFKTWILLEVALKVAAGDRLFGKYQTRQSGVLIVDEESGPRLLQQRLNVLGAPTSLPVYLMSLQNFKLEDASTTRLIRFCEDNDIKLVIFDSLVRLHAQDENDAGQMAKVFQQLKQFATHGVTVLVTHHNRKAGVGKSNPAQEMRGSSDILASVDCHLAITRLDNRSLVITQTKLRYAEEMPPITLDISKTESSLTIEYAGTLESGPSKKDELKKAILDRLALQPNLFQQQLFERLQETGIDVGMRTLRNVLNELCESGEIVKNPGERNTNLYRVNTEVDNV